MNKKLTYAGFMVPFDILLDTRLGSLAKHDPELAANLDHHAYRKRQNDKFGELTLQQFKDIYAKRDNEVAQLSVLTAFVDVLRKIVQTMALGNGTEFHPEMPRIYINMHPYVFTEEEEAELGLIVANLIKTEYVEIELISMAPEELTPEFCLEHFKFMVMYSDYSSWFDHHRKELQKGLLKTIVLFAPAIFDNEIPSADALEESMKGVGIHPIEMTELSVKDWIDLTFIDVKYFSIVDIAA